jgi:hypothetical protein
MSEALDRVRQVCAEFDAANPGWREDAVERQEREFEKRKREVEETARQRQARKAREAEKQQVASTNWYAAVDDRIRTHFKDWAWAAIDDRIQQHLDRHGEIFKDAVGAALGTIRKQVRDEFKLCLEKQQCSFEAKLTEQKERLLALHNSADGVQGQAQLRAEIKSALGELCSSFGTELAALEQRLKAVPGRLPPVKSWKPETVFYAGDVVTCDGSLFQASRDTGQSVTHSDWICLARGGRDGHDGLTPHVRGAYDAHKAYARLDIVEYEAQATSRAAMIRACVPATAGNC